MTKTWRKPSWHLAAVLSLPERQISVNHNFPQSKGIRPQCGTKSGDWLQCSPLSYYTLERRTLTLRTYFFRALRLAFPNKIIPYFFERQKEKSQYKTGSSCLNCHSFFRMAYFDSSGVQTPYFCAKHRYKTLLFPNYERLL